MNDTKTSEITTDKYAAIKPGATVRVYQKIQEGEKTRTQMFEGLVLSRHGGREPGATITVRKISEGVGVEKIFPLAMPSIEKIDVVKQAKVRRAKLYFVRDGKAKDLKD